MQERQAIEDRQMILSMQFYTPVYSGFFLDRWLPMLSMFSQLTPDDFKLLGWPAFVLRNYPIVDKSKLIKPILELWEKGGITYPELRRELGWTGVDVEATIEEWKGKPPDARPPGGAETRAAPRLAAMTSRLTMTRTATTITMTTRTATTMAIRKYSARFCDQTPFGGWHWKYDREDERWTRRRYEAEAPGQLRDDVRGSRHARGGPAAVEP